jgi:hypothetical protein
VTAADPPGTEHTAQVSGVAQQAQREGIMDLLWWIWLILFVAIWIAIAFWPARVARRKGHSFLGYFIFSLFFFPAALIVAYLVRDRTRSAVA